MLSVANLQVAYGDIQVVWDVSLEVPAGKIVALIGPNGAGKSTSLRAILGLLPVKAGEINFDGVSIRNKPTHAIVQSGLAMVPESGATFARLSVLDNLRLGAMPSAQARAQRSASLQTVFAMFPRLAERQTQQAGTLSGGERQMLAIGKALMARPRLLVLDEPSLGLAPLVVEQIFGVIQHIRQQGVAILLVEQNVQHSLEIADYGYVIEFGRIRKAAAAATLLADENIKEAYLSL
ncbi:MAG: ABC transporter ATP-binding protein [Anaerolineales bacterium]|jgi:branched-chain amino acid transport system ATP-binding protein|nr:ABC transporter ATP-binding protein [Anaerolineales bacterium]MCW5888592.1 ABC transporter ATP-binding protein [Anaerolineales bacterium]